MVVVGNRFDPKKREPDFTHFSELSHSGVGQLQGGGAFEAVACAVRLTFSLCGLAYFWPDGKAFNSLSWFCFL